MNNHRRSRVKSIKLSPDEEQTLRILHRASRIPDGQFAQRPQFLAELTATWNSLTGRDDAPSEIHHFIMTRRKRPKGRPGRWEPFGDEYERLACPGEDTFTAEQWSIAEKLYEELGVSADALLVDAEARREILRRFINETGEHIPELLFVAALVARRKAGALPIIGDGPDRGGIGFADIDEVA